MTPSTTPPRRLTIEHIAQSYQRSQTQIRKDVREGLFTRPIKPTYRTALWPATEVEAILAARAAGYVPDEIRALVKRMHAAREVEAAAEA